MKRTPAYKQPVPYSKAWPHTFFTTITVLSFYTGAGRAQLDIVKHVAMGQPAFAYCDGRVVNAGPTDIIREIKITKNDRTVLNLNKARMTKQNAITKWKIKAIGIETGSYKFEVTMLIPNATKDDEGTYKCRYLSTRQGFVYGGSRNILILYVQEPEKVAKCRNSWIQFSPEKTCIKFFNVKLSWEDAIQFCKDKHNAHLPVITTEKFDNFIGSVMQQKYPYSIWIGLRYDPRKSNWTWLHANVTEVVYHNWERTVGTPKGKKGQCVKKGPAGKALWMIQLCDREEWFTCQRKEGISSAWDALSMLYAILLIIVGLILVSTIIGLVISLLPYRTLKRLGPCVTRGKSKSKVDKQDLSDDDEDSNDDDGDDSD